MYQLIYAGKEVEEAIKARYPDAKIKDASDERGIKGPRERAGSNFPALRVDHYITRFRD